MTKLLCFYAILLLTPPRSSCMGLFTLKRLNMVAHFLLSHIFEFSGLEKQKLYLFKDAIFNSHEYDSYSLQHQLIQTLNKNILKYSHLLV